MFTPFGQMGVDRAAVMAGLKVLTCARTANMGTQFCVWYRFLALSHMYETPRLEQDTITGCATSISFLNVVLVLLVKVSNRLDTP